MGHPDVEAERYRLLEQWLERITGALDLHLEVLDRIHAGVAKLRTEARAIRSLVDTSQGNSQ